MEKNSISRQIYKSVKRVLYTRKVKSMTNVKITVLRTLNPKEVFGEEFPFKEPATTCTYFEEGQEFISEHTERPEGFGCSWAWHDLYKQVVFLYFGGVYFKGDPDVAITCCSDGKRPVIFKLERI